MLESASTRSSTCPATLLATAGAVCLALLCAAGAATPFTSATLTKVENKVRYGERRGDQSVLRDAAVSDVVRANNFLRSESDSRAELQYPDGTVVRIGQNTVFTFDAQSRTLTLEKGSMLFHIPKGAGGGTIKTASLTAAITGTAGKVSGNTIAIIEGTVKLIPSGQLVHAGEFARKNADGTITVTPFDPDHANDGALVHFNGLMPGFTETGIVAVTVPPLTIPDLRVLDVLTRTQSVPSVINRFEPLPVIDRRRRNKDDDVPRPDNGNGNPNPGVQPPRHNGGGGSY